MNNREELLKCALDAFTKRGYDAVGVQEIASAAGIKKPTLYHYFGSKSGLLTTLLSENFNPFFDRLQISATYQGDVGASLRSIVGIYFDFARSNPRLYRFYLSLWFSPPESEVVKFSLIFLERQEQILETFFLSTSRDHGNMKGRHKPYAASFLGLINTYVALSLNNLAEFDDRLVFSVVHQFMHGIFS